MRGAFGGTLVSHESEAVESADASLADLLRCDEDPRFGPTLVPIRARAGELVYAGDLRGLEPLAASPAGDGLVARLASLAAALEALSTLHAAGRVHGDLRPAHVWTGARTALSFPARALDAAVLLRARLRAGAEPVDVDYAAPEVLAGEPATRASDAFSAAALVHAALLGRPPHGAMGSFRALAPTLAPLELLVGRGLDPDPAARPPLAELATAVTRAREAVARAPSPAPRVSLVAAGSPAAVAGRPAKAEGSSAILGCLLAVGGFFLVSGAIGVAALSFAAMNEAGRFALLFLVSLGIAVAGGLLERRGFLRSGFALVTIATQLVWANGAYLIVVLRAEDDAGAWVALAALVAGLTEVLALARRSAVLSTLAAVDTAIACLFLGASLKAGSREGPAVWCAVTAAILGAVAFVGQKRGGVPTGLPATLAAAVFVAASWIAALVLLADRPWDPDAPSVQGFAVGWPYALTLGAAGAGVGLARLEARPYAVVAWVLAVLGAALTPTVEALACWESLGHRYVATVLGGGLVVAAFHSPALAREQARQLLAVLAGLVSLTVGPTLLALATLGGWQAKSGDQLAWELLDPSLPIEARLHHPLATLAHLCGIAGALVALGVLFAREAERKIPYRALEVAGLAAFFFALTCLSFARPRDYLYPLVLFLGGFGALGVGAWQRHMLLVVLPAAALVLNIWVQYFGKLTESFPLPLLLMGFGVAVLGGGVLFEKKVKPLLPELRTWA